MTREQREQFLVSANEATSRPQNAMGRLRFFQGMAELFDTAELLGRLTGMMQEIEAKAEQAEAKANAAEAEAKQAGTEAGQARAKVEQALTGMRETILTVLQARGIPCADDARSRLMSCDDLPTLQRRLLRATTAATASEVFEGEDPAQRE